MITMEAEGAKQGDVIAACVPMLERAVSSHGRSGELSENQLAGAQLQLGMLKKLDEQKESAWGHFEAAIHASPKSPVTAEARNELAVLAVEREDWDRAERLLREAIEIDPRHEKANRNLKLVQQERETFEIIFHVMSLPGGKTVVRVSPDETLGDIGARVLPGFELPTTGGMFIYSGDDALPAELDMGQREPHQTVRELGVKPRDTIVYFDFQHARATDEADRLLRSVEQHRIAGFPALARREIRWALESVIRHQADEQFDEAEALLEAVLQLDADNSEARTLLAEVQTAIGTRDAGSERADGVSWLHGYGSPARTSQTVRGPIPPLHSVWEFEAGNGLTASPVVGHDCIYLPSRDHLYCLDMLNGQERWKWEAGSVLEQAPVAGAQRVYVVDRESLYCLAGESDRTIWRVKGTHLRSPVLKGNQLFVAAADGTLRCLNAETGHLVRALASGERQLHSLAVDEDRVVAVSNRAVVCADKSLRRVLWRQEGRFDEAMPILAHGRVYVGTFEDGLWSLDVKTGRRCWIFATDAWVRAAPAAGRGRIYFGDTAGRFGCLNALTGELLWTPREWLTNRCACSTAPVVAGPFVYVLLDDGVLYCLDTLRGVETWRVELERWQGGVGSLAVTSRAVYYTTRGGRAGCVGDASLRSPSGRGKMALPDAPGRGELPPLDGNLETAKVEFRDFGQRSSLSVSETNEMHQAVYLLMGDRLDEAIAILRQLERDRPDEEIVLQNLARAYESRGFVGEALATFDHILELNPGDLEAFAAMGRLLRTHPDIIEQIYGPPRPIMTPSRLDEMTALEPGLRAVELAGRPVFICQVDRALANVLATSPAWYWWQLFESSQYPVLRIYMEFDYQPFRTYDLLLPLDIGEEQTASWLRGVLQVDELAVHLYDQSQEYCCSRHLSFASAQRARLRRLIDRAQRYMSTLPLALRSFHAAVQEVQHLDNRTPGLADQSEQPPSSDEETSDEPI